jgi:hypothetical protein
MYTDMLENYAFPQLEEEGVASFLHYAPHYGNTLFMTHTMSDSMVIGFDKEVQSLGL